MRVRVPLVVIAAVFLAIATAHAGIALYPAHVFSARAGDTVVVDVSFHRVEVTAKPGDTVEVVVDIEVATQSRLSSTSRSRGTGRARRNTSKR